MKWKIVFLTLLLAGTFLLPQSAFPQDSTHMGSTAQDPEFEVFLLLFGIVAISVIIGSALTIVALMIVGAMFTGFMFLLAAISVPIIAGIYKKSWKAVVRTALYIFCPVAGMLAGLVCTSLFNAWHEQYFTRYNMIAGAVGGAIGGALLAWGLLRLGSGLLARMKAMFAGRFN